MEARQSPNPINEPMITFTTFQHATVTTGQIKWLPATSDSNQLSNGDPTDRANNYPNGANLIHQPGTLSQFTVFGILPNIGQTVVITLWLNGAATPLSLTITNASDDGFGNAQATYAGAPLSIPANSLIAIQIDCTATTGSFAGQVTMLFIPL